MAEAKVASDLTWRQEVGAQQTLNPQSEKTETVNTASTDWNRLVTAVDTFSGRLGMLES